ncbi:MAG: outer membrane lipoprotein carrier protein LolA [Bacteroidaceae bacterium]|nr:outer membrane lipoprotein carrier protein LolA [Bacteroidaceae bacterium]
MKYIILTILFSLCTALTAVAQTDAIDEISKASQAVSTVQADFTQTKRLKMLNDAMVSKGKMWCTQPNRLRWEYLTPYSSLFVLNGEKVLFQNDKRSTTLNANRHKRIREMIRIMIPSNLGKVLTEKKDFHTSIETTENQYVLTMIPQSKEMKQMFTRIVLYYNRKQAVVTQIEMYEKSGDSTTIELSSIKKNTTINPSVYNTQK